MNDYIIRAIAANDQIRAFAAVTTETVETARQDHNTSPVATAALGRLLTAGTMMGVMMKGDKDILTLQVKGDGPIQGYSYCRFQRPCKGICRQPEVIFRQMQGKTGCIRSCRQWISPGDQRYGTERTICRTGRTADW